MVCVRQIPRKLRTGLLFFKFSLFVCVFEHIEAFSFMFVRSAAQAAHSDTLAQAQTQTQMRHRFEHPGSCHKSEQKVKLSN